MVRTNFQTFRCFPNYNGIRPTNNNIYIYIRCVQRRRIDDKSKGQRETGATERNAASDEKVRGEGMVKVARGAPFEQREVSASSS